MPELGSGCTSANDEIGKPDPHIADNARDLVSLYLLNYLRGAQP